MTAYDKILITVSQLIGAAIGAAAVGAPPLAMGFAGGAAVGLWHLRRGALPGAPATSASPVEPSDPILRRFA